MIVETVQGIELGLLPTTAMIFPLTKLKKLKPVLRIATDSDLEQYNQNLEKNAKHSLFVAINRGTRFRHEFSWRRLYVRR